MLFLRQLTFFERKPSTWSLKTPANNYKSGFNRYTYCFNNPLIYTDPSGEFFWAALPIATKIAIAVGAAIGTYTGYKIADAKGYDMGNWQTYGYMLGGGIIGGVSGYAGATIAAGGGFMANTAGIMASSGINSVGMTALSGGMIQPSISFGVASFDFGTGEWGYLGKGGNSALANIGYGFGALANVQDLFAWTNGTNIDVSSHNSFNGETPHSYITGDNIDISVANATSTGAPNFVKYAWRILTNPKKYNEASYYNVLDKSKDWTVTLNNVRAKGLQNITANIKSVPPKGLFGWGNLRFGVGFGCVQHASRSLLANGVWYIPFNIMPQMLNTQLLIRQFGIYSSPYLVNY